MYILTTAPDEFNAELMESLLESFDIPVKKYFANGISTYPRSIGGYYRAGIPIFVSNEHLERAREALNIKSDNNIPQEREKFYSNLAIFMLLPVLIGILIWILKLIH